VVVLLQLNILQTVVFSDHTVLLQGRTTQCAKSCRVSRSAVRGPSSGSSGSRSAGGEAR
jgi:hypothetical protein